jgi:hypothetical protein
MTGATTHDNIIAEEGGGVNNCCYLMPWNWFEYREPEPRSDIFRLENLSVWQIPVFRYVLLRRN